MTSELHETTTAGSAAPRGAAPEPPGSPQPGEHTAQPGELTLRPLAGVEELGLFNQLSYLLDEEVEADLKAGRRRPEWMWVALSGDRLLARLAWWSRPGDESPLLMDFFDLAEDSPEAARAAEALLRKATAAVLPEGSEPVEWTRFLDPDWRGNESSRRPVEQRMAVLEGTGARLLVERLRLEWRPGSPVPEDDGRLLFRPVADSEELLDLMTAALHGTLDAHSADELTRMSARESAVKHYEEELALYSSPRDWWRVATLPDGEPVGFVLPARNSYNAIIAYLAVLPAHRGKGFIDPVLAEGTRILAAQDVPRIRASTDLGNQPMARAFARAGYLAFQHEINMAWS